jgi:sugar phosphate isomerase/epimerase
VVPEPRPIALQLWTVREELEADRAAALRRIARSGFGAVELFGLGRRGITRAERIARAAGLRRQLDDEGLLVCAAHGRLPAGAELDAVLDALEILGGECLIVPSPDSIDGCESALESADGVRAMADRLNAAAARAAARGLSVGYHNHWQEWQRVHHGRPAFELLWERLDPAVVAEVDVYWARVGGQDPAAVIEGLGARARLLHVKDGPGDTDSPQTALGEGVVDLDATLAAGRNARWHVVELDDCATDKLDAAKAGGDWLVERGWSRWKV